MTTHRIVVGLDGSEGSERALHWCVEYAAPLAAEVIAVHALEPFVRLVPERGMLSTYVATDAVVRTQLEQSLEEWCAPLRDAAVPYRALLMDGQPAKVLDGTAQQEGADLIVVGRRGRGGFAQLVLGSVSNQLSHHARVPVVIIPAG